MEFTESEEIRSLRDTLRRFVEKECTSEVATKWDKEDHIPREIMLKFADLGLCGLCVSEEHGGMGRQVVAMTVVLEELSRGSVALSGLYNMNAGYGGMNISESGSEEQKRRLLPGLLEGKLLFAYDLSEPDVGADLGNVKTRAERKGDKVSIERDLVHR